MSEQTRGGIFHNLDKSTFTIKIFYDSDQDWMCFCFSSNMYLEKFKNRLSSNRESISKLLSQRYGFEIINDKLCDIYLYSRIEKRGFLIKHPGGDYKWLSNIRLDGSNLTLKNLEE